MGLVKTPTALLQPLHATCPHPTRSQICFSLPAYALSSQLRSPPLQILENKISKLEQLLRLKDAKIQALLARLAADEPPPPAVAAS